LQRSDRFGSASLWTAPKALVAACCLAAFLPTGIFGAQSTGVNADAEALVKAGHWKRARQILEPWVKTNPQDATSCYLLSEVRLAFGNLNEALLFAQHSVELDGKNSDFHYELGKVYGEMADRASYFSAGSLAVKFRKEMETAIELDPKNLDALDAMMQFKYQAPGIMGGNKDEAQSLADRISALNLSEGYLARAELAVLEKDPHQEEADYLKAEQADPHSFDAEASLAKFYSQSAQSKYADAGKHAQASIKIARGRIDGHWVLARVYAVEQKWGDLDGAVADAEKDVWDDLRPEYEAAEGLFEIGKDFPRAEAYLKKYLSQEPEAGEPDAADAHRLLGLMLEKEGRKSEALAEIQNALRIRPNFKAAKEDLKRLED
jgi:tetratricopeptide (TPR) repeat protein